MRMTLAVRWVVLLAGCSVLFNAALAQKAPAVVAGKITIAAKAAAPAAEATMEPADASSAALASPVQLAPGKTRVITLSKMGGYGAIPLRGLDPKAYLNVGVRTDEVVTAAKLKLVYTYSPALIESVSHIKVLLNGETVATLPLDKASAGQEVTKEVDLDPRLFTDFNSITLQMIAHYTLDQCEDPYHSSLWADISAASSLALTTSQINLPDNLALLPAPFFDRHDNRRVDASFVLPANADAPTLRSAGVVASWLGTLASYRGAHFSVLNAPPANAHAIVLALPDQMPAGLSLGEIKGPTVTLVPNPAAPPESGYELLVLAGRNADELAMAANALVLGQVGMSGNSVIVKSVDLGPGRKPYDAPNWAPVDRLVLFKELVSDPQQLEASGFNPPMIRVNMRVPPDLFAWARKSVPLEVRYRYTAPSTYNDSVINIKINDGLVRSDRLKPLRGNADEAHLNIPLITGGDNTSSQDLRVPSLRVAGSNQFQFQFHMDSQKTGLCVSTATDSARASIDPDSNVDFSDFVHYAVMPNLAFFAGSGYPFTRMADLADTAVVVPDKPDIAEQEALLDVLGMMGRWSGLPTLRVTVVPASGIDSVKSRDLLLIGTGSVSDLMAKWNKGLPLLIHSGSNALKLRDQDDNGWHGALGGNDPVTSPQGIAVMDPNGPLGAIVGFESPYASGRSVVALTGTSSAQLASLLDVLGDDAKSGQIRGDLSVVRAKQVAAVRVGDSYYVGHLPWYAWIWVRLSNYPALMALAGILAGIFVALTVFWALGRLAARRIEG